MPRFGYSRIQHVTMLQLLSLTMLLLLSDWTPIAAGSRRSSTICHGFSIPNSVASTTGGRKNTFLNKSNKRRNILDHHHGHFTKSDATIRCMEASKGGGGGGDETVSSSSDNNEQLQGRALLCLVALLYGTLNVSLRLIYQLPTPPSASMMSATRGWLASGCFIPLLLWNKSPTNNDETNKEASTYSQQQSSSSSSLFMAGLELAVWNFLAQGLLNIGLLSTGSARASFLTQTSVVLTPMISLFAGQIVPPTVWMGCGIALVGLTLLSGGGGGGGGGILSGMAFSQGDCLILGGALSWSLYLFRLSKIGSSFDEIKLQAVKTVLLAVLYSAWAGYSLLGSGGGSFFAPWMTSLAAWATLLYSALGPGTLADVLQQQGQKSVSASEANVLLSMEPVFAALCARLFLGEVLSTMEFLGGGLILVAALVATMTTTKTTDATSSD